jgi:hypothetical protein
MDWSLPAYRFSKIYKRRSHGLERAMDWSFPEVSLRVPSCVLIFFHYFNSEKMGYFTIRVSPRIPVRVQYPALIRHLCAVSLQRSMTPLQKELRFYSCIQMVLSLRANTCPCIFQIYTVPISCCKFGNRFLILSLLVKLLVEH